tara:strand:+ start:349 stop:546 length:198 start_codon:yes stop_codon:yes gene_type:complete
MRASLTVAAIVATITVVYFSGAIANSNVKLISNASVIAKELNFGRVKSHQHDRIVKDLALEFSLK